MGRHFPLHASAAAKVSIFAERLALVAARLSRNPTFAPPIAGSVRRDHVMLTAVDALPTVPTGDQVNVLGVLTQPEEGLWCLEDGQKCVALNLSAAQRVGGFFTEMSVVLVQGFYDADATTTDMIVGGAAAGATAAAAGGASASAASASAADVGSSSSSSSTSTRFVPLVDGRLPGVLSVDFIVHPPEESRSDTLKAMSLEDPLGHIKSPAEYARALALEKADIDAGADTGKGSAASSSGLGAAVGALQRSHSHGSRGRGTGMGIDAAVSADAKAAELDADGDDDEEAIIDLTGAAAGSEPRSSEPRSFAILSDVHLDRPATVEALGQLLRSYASLNALPAVLVLMGAFCSTPFGQLEGDRDRFASRMEDLARLLASIPQLRTAGTQVVLVPGPTDPGTSGALPRPALPAFFCRSLMNNPKLPTVHLASNPCRLRWYTQEVLLFRGDLTNKLRRRAILAPFPADAEPAQHTLDTVVKQGHLCPLPLSVQPLYWEHDHALRLCPLPDILVLAEGRERYALTHEGTGMQMLNPGPFHKDSDFLFYVPGSRVAALCRVNEPEDDAHAHAHAHAPEYEHAARLRTEARSAAATSTSRAVAPSSRSASISASAAASAMRSAGGGGASEADLSASAAGDSAGRSTAARSSAARGLLAAEDEEAADADADAGADADAAVIAEDFLTDAAAAPPYDAGADLQQDDAL